MANWLIQKYASFCRQKEAYSFAVGDVLRTLEELEELEELEVLGKT